MWRISHYHPFPQDNKDNSNIKTNTKLILIYKSLCFMCIIIFNLHCLGSFFPGSSISFAKTSVLTKLFQNAQFRNLFNAFEKEEVHSEPISTVSVPRFLLSFVLRVSLSPQMQNGFWFQTFGWVGWGPWKIHGNYINTRLQWKLKCKRERRVNPCCVKEENKSQLCSRKVPASKR